VRNLATFIICPHCKAELYSPYLGDKIWGVEFQCNKCTATLIAFEALGEVQIMKAPPAKDVEWRQTKVPYLMITNGEKKDE